MSFFSTELRRLMEKRFAGSQIRLSRKSGVTQGTLSRALSGTTPRRAQLEKLLAAFDRVADRNALLAARARDILPAGVKPGSEKQDQRDRMPNELRAAFNLALENPKFAAAILALYRLLK